MGLFGHGGGLSKAWNETKNAAKKTFNYAEDVVTQGFKDVVVNPLRATGHVLQAGYYAAGGDWHKAGYALDKSAKEFTSAAVGASTFHLLPGLSRAAGDAAEIASALVRGDINRSEQNLENALGHDIDNSEARAYNKAVLEATLAAERQEAKRAEEMADNQRRASLYALRRQVGAVNVGVRSSVFGGGSGDKEKTATGVVLG